MKLNQEQIAAIILGLVSIGLLFNIGSAPQDSALFPRIVLTFTLILSASIFLRHFEFFQRILRSSIDTGEYSAPPESFFIDSRRFILSIFLIGFYVASIGLLGFYSSSLIFIVISAFLLGENRIIVILAGAAAFLIFVYLVFSLLFSRPLPTEFFLSSLNGNGSITNMGVRNHV